jgi:hypothetical protein
MLGMGNNISLEHVFSALRFEVIGVRIQPDYMGRMAGNMATHSMGIPQLES